MPKRNDNTQTQRQRKVWKTDFEWEQLYTEHLDSLTKDVELLEHINKHQRPIYIPEISQSSEIEAYESYIPTD